MTREQSREIIEQAINAALMKGIYSLDDVKLIIQAVEKAFEVEE